MGSELSTKEKQENGKLRLQSQSVLYTGNRRGSPPFSTVACKSAPVQSRRSFPWPSETEEVAETVWARENRPEQM